MQTNPRVLDVNFKTGRVIILARYPGAKLCARFHQLHVADITVERLKSELAELTFKDPYYETDRKISIE